MTLAPDLTEQLARARSDLRMGVPIVLGCIEPIVFVPTETLKPDRLESLRAMSGELTLAITSRRAETLKARAYDGDIARIDVPDDADLNWIHSIGDPADDLRHPMKGPLGCARDGDPTAYRLALQITKLARLLPAVLCMRIENPLTFAEQHHLVFLPADEIAALVSLRSRLTNVVSAQLPMEVSDQGRLHVFRPEDGGEEHYAIEIGRPDRAAPVLARLHSACFTGDLMGSLKCDCGPQLRAALRQMGEQGSGILLYMNQEGRGIGLANKMRAYSLQDQGFDTVEANHRLGFEDDERDFRLGADILQSLGFKSVKLLTNNPRKVDMMTQCGIEVQQRVPLHVGENPHNRLYLATKVAKSGHLE